MSRSTSPATIAISLTSQRSKDQPLVSAPLMAAHSAMIPTSRATAAEIVPTPATIHKADMSDGRILDILAIK